MDVPDGRSKMHCSDQRWSKGKKGGRAVQSSEAKSNLYARSTITAATTTSPSGYHIQLKGVSFACALPFLFALVDARPVEGQCVVCVAV
jgi:hypothetical protein